MNALERAQVLKEARDAGWDNLVKDSPERLVLTSLRLPGRVVISCQTDRLAVKFTNVRLQAKVAAILTGWPLDYQENFVVAYEPGRLHHSLPLLAQVLRSTSAEMPNPVDAEFAQRPPCETEGASAGYPEKTEVERLVRERLGQQQFRQALFTYWQGACAVTGIALAELLRASHSKPWAMCASDHERLDPYNGFLLCANLDALYDAGLITFLPSGELRVSQKVPLPVQRDLGLDRRLALCRLDERHLPYLRFHRDNVFQDTIE